MALLDLPESAACNARASARQEASTSGAWQVVRAASAACSAATVAPCAKKYIATGAHGGRHLVDESGARVDNPTYGAALVGDTVGDPLKDLAGPAMHVLVKMLPVVTIVFLPFFV